MVSLEDLTVAKVTLQPGWNWEKHVKPKVKTNSCEFPHTSYLISGRMKAVMDDGTEVEGGPGSVAIVPPGHNSWVVGEEPAVMLDIAGIKEYVKGR
jgi:quercetin dioxygenase-like cupin family protein